jgi:hypothetical protein
MRLLAQPAGASGSRERAHGRQPPHIAQALRTQGKHGSTSCALYPFAQRPDSRS